MNAITPLKASFALIVTFAQKYQKDAGVGTVVALLLPYVAIIFVGWTILLAAWHLVGLPWGSASLGPIPSVPPGYFDSPPNARSKSARAVQNPRSAT